MDRIELYPCIIGFFIASFQSEDDRLRVLECRVWLWDSTPHSNYGWELQRVSKQWFQPLHLNMLELQLALKLVLNKQGIL